MKAPAVVAALGGRWHGTYGSARCPCHDDRAPSLSVRDGDGGGILVKCHAGCDWRDIKEAMRDRGLLPPSQSDYVPRQSVPRQSVPRREPRSDPDQERRREFARRIWAGAQAIQDTPAEVYLRERGLQPGNDGWPPTLRYHAGLKHGPTGLILPALVAGVARWPGHDVSGVHRTFIRIDGKGKAPVSTNKAMLGPCAGGAVRLAPAGPELLIAEGIETALTVQQESNLPAWACLSTSGMQSVILPPEAHTIIIAADGDDPGEAAAQKAARRFLAEGRKVKIARPPRGFDFNEMLQLPTGIAVISDQRRRSRAHD